MTDTTDRLDRRWPTAAPNGLAASVLLAFLATAGLFYVNIMPALVNGLTDGLGLSDKIAGLVASANIYGAAVGALVPVFLIKYVPWRPSAVGALVGLILMDIVSMFIIDGVTLIGARFIHGFIGGLLVGIGFAVIARTALPDRTFGMLLVVQFGMGGAGVMILPRLVPVYGPDVVFVALILFSVITLAMLPFLGAYPPRQTQTVTRDTGSESVRRGPLALTLGAIFLFQAANMALAAFMINLGRAYGLETGFISTTIGIAAWIGAVGSVLVVVMATRYGRTWPIAGGMVLTFIGCAAFLESQIAWVFIIANCGTAITWAFVIPYLLGMSAAFDPYGRSAALGGFVSKMGLASGPLVAAFVIEASGYPLLIGIVVVGLAASGILALIPARRLDSERDVDAAPVPAE